MNIVKDYQSDEFVIQNWCYWDSLSNYYYCYYYNYDNFYKCYCLYCFDFHLYYKKIAFSSADLHLKDMKEFELVLLVHDEYFAVDNYHEEYTFENNFILFGNLII